jgi:hypothetical protein
LSDVGASTAVGPACLLLQHTTAEQPVVTADAELSRVSRRYPHLQLQPRTCGKASMAWQARCCRGVDQAICRPWWDDPTTCIDVCHAALWSIINMQCYSYQGSTAATKQAALCSWQAAGQCTPITSVIMHLLLLPPSSLSGSCATCQHRFHSRAAIAACSCCQRGVQASSGSSYHRLEPCAAEQLAEPAGSAEAGLLGSRNTGSDKSGEYCRSGCLWAPQCMACKQHADFVFKILVVIMLSCKPCWHGCRPRFSR